MTRFLTALLLLLLTAGAAEAQFLSPSVYTTRWSAVVTNSTSTSLAEIQAAPAAGLSLYITDIVMSSSAAATTATDAQLTLKYGTGSNCATDPTAVASYFNAATAGVAISLHTPIKLPAAKALCFIHAAAGNKSVVVNGYTAP